MASLGLITGVLGFNETGTALMLTIFALQDSFGTACNVTGDGALTLTVTSRSPAKSQSKRYVEKMAGIAGIPATVEKHLTKFHFKYLSTL